MIGSITSNMQTIESDEGYMREMSITQLKDIVLQIQNKGDGDFNP